MKCLEREDCNDGACVGHCPKCASNQIGGGGCNGMFCSSCGHTWDGPNDPAPSHWNYRFLIHNDEDGAAVYSLHECYYESGETEPSSWTKEPVGLIASDLEWLKKVLLEALDKPAIDKRPDRLGT